jgi:tetratricopeptide (TPR) repeat protein
LRQIKFIQENKEYGIVGSNFFIIDETGSQIDRIRNPRKHTDIVEQLPRRCCIWDGSILFRKAIINKLGGFNESLIAGEDWDFFLRAIGMAKFYNIQEFLSTKRIHSASISETDIAKQTTKKILLNYNNTIIKNSEVRTEIAKSYFNIGYYYYYESDFINAYKYFREALHKGGMNFQYVRYSFSAKYLKSCINFYRRYRLYKLFDWIRYFDNTNKFMRNKF